jgi:G:T-mismatch repair DNA endonuclease (very short patch repair protein)
VPRHRLLPGVFIGSHAVAAGLISTRQLRTLGYRRLVHGVYADPSLPVDHQLRCRAVALLIPDGAAIGGHSAAAWHGAPFAGATDPVTVVGPADMVWAGPRGVRVHRSREPVAMLRDGDGVPVTSASRTAWDVAALESLGTAVAALDAMVRNGALSLTNLSALSAAGTTRWGVTRVRRAVDFVDPRAESPPESRVRVALVMAGLSPVPQYEVWSQGRLLGRVDLALPEARIAIEYEGAYHFEDGQIVRDDERYERLRAAGWTVIRLSSVDLRDLDAVVARVRAAFIAISAARG